MWVLMVFLTVFNGGAAISQTPYRSHTKCDEAKAVVENVSINTRGGVSAVCIYGDAMP